MLTLTLSCATLATISFMFDTTLFTTFFLVSFLFLCTVSEILCLVSSYKFRLRLVQLDSVALLLMFITFMVLLLRHATHGHANAHHYQFTLTMLGVYITSYFVFSTDNFLVLYVSYEASLIPIIFTILKWGPYPDRQQSALIMLFFTSFFTFPIAVLVLLYFSAYHSLMFLLLSNNPFSFILAV